MRDLIDIVETTEPSQFVHDFKEGYCYALAIELSRRYGWPICVIASKEDDGDDPVTIHAFNELPNGQGIDIEGARPVDDILYEYAGGEDWDVLKRSRIDVLNSLNPEYRSMTIQAAGYARQAVDEYLKVTYPDLFP
jgi:hypothetical protein